MTVYSDKAAELSRTPCSLMKMTLDYCANTFGSAPCTATGEECYNTFPTCKDTANYVLTTKDYKFTSSKAPLPFDGVRPYLKDVDYMATEIKDDNKLKYARVKAILLDEPDTDVGIDPYLSSRASVQGSYWKKHLARNPNYKGREVRFSDGFDGLAEVDFVEKFVGKLENIKILKNGEMQVEAVDLMKVLSKTDIPQKVNIELNADIDAVVTDIILKSLDGLDQPAGYVKIEDELIAYSAVNVTTNEITGCTRGWNSTTKATHDADTKVEKVAYFAQDSGYEHMQTILSLAGIDNAYVNTTAFDGLKTYPVTDINREAVITTPTKANVLYFELVDEHDCKSWVNEDLEITIEKNIQNLPGRTFHTFTDEAGIVLDSGKVDLNDSSRISRITVYWNKSSLGKVDDSDSYNRIDQFIDADAEGVNEYNGEQEKVFYSRWLNEGLDTEENLNNYILANFSRQLFRLRDAQTKYTFKAEIKDQEVKTGDFAKITTNDMQEIDGNPVTERIFQIIRREPGDDEIDLKVIAMPKKRIAFFAPAGTPDYSSASGAEREYGFFSGADEKMPAGDQGYYFY